MFWNHGAKEGVRGLANSPELEILGGSPRLRGKISVSIDKLGRGRASITPRAWPGGTPLAQEWASFGGETRLYKSERRNLIKRRSVEEQEVALGGAEANRPFGQKGFQKDQGAIRDSTWR